MSVTRTSMGAERRDRLIRELVVQPGLRPNLDLRRSRLSGEATGATIPASDLEATARAVLKRGVKDLADAQELLWASDARSVLLVFQAMDAAGKDSTIKHVMSGVNPQGVQVVSFRKPSAEELDHTFLWRIARALPERGRIGIFNRSHYEEVVALKVHPEWLGQQRLPDTDRGPAFWSRRFEDINAFERHLDTNGTKVVKFFLHVSKEEQRRRFFARLDNPNKLWKFNAADVTERAHWEEYMSAYEEAIAATSTPWAPWYVIPADDKHVLQALTIAIIVDAIQSLGLRWPTVSEDDLAANVVARGLLEQEPSRSSR